MIIYKNGFIKLEFEPATDILSFEMPTVDSVLMPEMKRSLHIIVEHARNYDVKKILLDARNTDIGVEENDYGTIIAEFYRGLAVTRVERVARIVNPASRRETIVNKILDTVTYTMEVQRFTDVPSAYAWLKEHRQL